MEDFLLGAVANNQHNYCDIFSVPLLQEETIGLIPVGVLCILLRKYNIAGLVFIGGEQKSTVSFSSSPFDKRSFNIGRQFSNRYS